VDDTRKRAGRVYTKVVLKCNLLYAPIQRVVETRTSKVDKTTSRDTQGISTFLTFL
jgi:hypothetical protein